MSFEASLSVLAASEVTFSDESKVEATIVRGLLGVVLHLGDKQLVPYARAGIGARVSNYKLSSAEDKLHGSFLFWGGLGIDFWASEGFVIGTSLRVIGPNGSDDPLGVTFEAGAHAGVAWLTY